MVAKPVFVFTQGMPGLSSIGWYHPILGMRGPLCAIIVGWASKTPIFPPTLVFLPTAFSLQFLIISIFWPCNVLDFNDNSRYKNTVTLSFPAPPSVDSLSAIF
eukprot:GEMP01128489.1.p1 GENE.GEMP01128489.1~~GEMP01128489.1.p1  ORF type:complete len:103 (+),score=1.12 GEMP01128489.1:199-507(+)